MQCFYYVVIHLCNNVWSLWVEAKLLWEESYSDVKVNNPPISTKQTITTHRSQKRGTMTYHTGYPVQDFYCLLMFVLMFEIQLSRWEGHNTFNQLNLATFLCLSQANPWISSFFSSSMVWGLCSLCWYWWNCWPSPFKLSYHNILQLLLQVRNNQHDKHHFTFY